MLSADPPPARPRIAQTAASIQTAHEHSMGRWCALPVMVRVRRWFGDGFVVMVCCPVVLGRPTPATLSVTDGSGLRLDNRLKTKALTAPNVVSQTVEVPGRETGIQRPGFDCVQPRSDNQRPRSPICAGNRALASRTASGVNRCAVVERPASCAVRCHRTLPTVCGLC